MNEMFEKFIDFAMTKTEMKKVKGGDFCSELCCANGAAQFGRGTYNYCTYMDSCVYECQQ